MFFLDEAVITAKSGDGGHGCVSFLRERFRPKGGPDGGDGGDGGDIIVKATSQLQTLSHFRSKPHFKASNGQAGRGRNQSGKRGTDLLLKLPLGTLIRDEETGRQLADLIHDQEEFILLSGGKGGKGNQHFATATRRAPRISQEGTPGQEATLRLSLKFLADVGLIGLPNAGKSTLLSRLTTARPKIDNYPFTTLVPNLGVLDLPEHRKLTIADIPGLIEGASQGRGLGHRFLKHIERTKLLLHLLDITYCPEGNLLEDFYTLREEMTAFNPGLAEKPQMVLINKIDLENPGGRKLNALKAALDRLGIPSLAVSALTGKGLDTLREVLYTRFFKRRHSPSPLPKGSDPAEKMERTGRT